MIDNPLSYLDKLFELFTERNVSGHDQLVCLHIFEKFNRSHWADTIRIADRELQDLCRLYDSNGKPISIDTIRKAKARLKLKKLIDFKAGSGNNPTEYHFIPLNPTDTPTGTPTDTPAETAGDLGLVPYTHTRNAGGDEAAGQPPASPPLPPGPPNPTLTPPGTTTTTTAATRAHEAAGQTEAATGTATLAGANPLRSPENTEWDIHDLWLYETGYALKGSVAFELERLANENFDLMHAAIKEAVASSNKVSFKYVKAIFESLKRGKPKKEGERVAGSSDNTRATARASKYDTEIDPDAPWAGYVEE